MSPQSQPSAKSSTLLYIDASPRGRRSHSRRVGQRFLSAWTTAHPDARVISRDIGNEPPPFVTEAWVEGAYAPAEQQSVAAREAIAVSNTYVDELLTADEIVIATPIYNLSVPAVLKAWIDQVVRAGRTFGLNAGGYVGLAGDKRVIVIVASGGDSRPGTPAAAYNFIEPYLRGILGFIGISRVEFVYAHSLSQPEEQRETIIDQAASEAARLAEVAA